jgi:hypothetical protein
MKEIKYILVIILFCSCVEQNGKTINSKLAGNSKDTIPIDTFLVYTPYSSLENEYRGFNSAKAINKIAEIENEYFNNYQKSYSKYYGTVWYESAIDSFIDEDSISIFEKYKLEINKLNESPDSMHCTIYAIEALKAGLDSNFVGIENKHKEIWGDREYAGWSIAYILVKYYNWQAYLFISNHSDEYNICLTNFKKDKTYHVWKQPNIKINRIFNFETEKREIDSLLAKNEFGWGFSDQGWHTWITRHKMLKECNWAGSPSNKFPLMGKPLFLATEFTKFNDYLSHIIVFPPKKE